MARWTADSIAAEIRHRFDAGQDLSYSGVNREHLGLLRAATRHLGSWERAVESAGIPYASVRRYRQWDRESIQVRIRELHSSGKDLSWRHVATQLDPPLAAAAVKSSHYGSWQSALLAAGLDYEEIRRYRDWREEEKLFHQIRRRMSSGAAMNAKSLEADDVALLTAARRRYKTWTAACAAAQTS